MTTYDLEKLTPRQKHIKIAEACGAKWEVREPNTCFVCNGSIYGVEGPNGAFISICLPDYTNDLNAMSKAEATLTDAQESMYGQYLAEEVCKLQNDGCNFDGALMYSNRELTALVKATAAQRVDAFLLTVDLYPAQQNN